jgi:hypothetical protein
MELRAAPSTSVVPSLPHADNIDTFSVQAFAESESVAWDRSSMLTKLLTIAVVCNKAKFTLSDEDGKAGERVSFFFGGGGVRCRRVLPVNSDAAAGPASCSAHARSLVTLSPTTPAPHPPPHTHPAHAAAKSPNHTAVTVPMFQGGVNDRKILGDATDSGLLRYCDKLTPSSLVRMAYKKVGWRHAGSACAVLTAALLLWRGARPRMCRRAACRRRCPALTSARSMLLCVTCRPAGV